MTDNIKPAHYRTGEIDLFESWYQTLPWGQYRSVMVSHAEKYMKRIKNNTVEDLEKAIYVLQRLKEKEIEHAGESEEVVTKDGMKVFKEDKLLGKIKMEAAGQYLDEVYYHHYNLLKRLQNADYEYLARDEDGGLWTFRVKPKKEDDFWNAENDYQSTMIENDNFSEIQWADDEPTKISKLLATHENGGENGK